MGTKQLNNKKSHNRIRTGREVFRKSLPDKCLQNISEPLPSLVSRETLVNHFKVKTYERRKIDIRLIDPVTFQSKIEN